MLILQKFKFDGEARESSLFQSIYSCIKMFSWATFTLYSFKYAIVDRFWAFFWKYNPPGQPGISQNQLLILNLDEMHLTESFAGLLIYLC